MAQPHRGQIHIDSVLTNLSVANFQAATQFIAPEFAPLVPVDKQSGKYFIYDQAWYRKPQSQKRAPATESVGTGYQISNDNYFCDVWALHHDVPDQDRDNADSPLSLDADALAVLEQDMLIRRELECASALFADSVWTGSSTGSDITVGVSWDQVASDPIGDIDTQKSAILENTGQDANVLVLGYDVFTQLKNHEDLLDRVKYTQRGVITEDLMAALFGVEKILVARASSNTLQEGDGDNEDFIFNQKDAVLLRVAQSPGLRTPSAAYIFTWTGHIPNAFGIAAGRFDVPLNKAERIELEMAFDFKVVSATLGAKFDAAVA